jgi:hypothetical protein
VPLVFKLRISTLKPRRVIVTRHLITLSISLRKVHLIRVHFIYNLHRIIRKRLVGCRNPLHSMLNFLTPQLALFTHIELLLDGARTAVLRLWIPR